MSKNILSFIKVILIAIAIVFILIILLIYLLTHIGTKYSGKIYSPDAAYYALADETNGGATTGFISGVTIVNAKFLFSNFYLLSAWSGNTKNVFGFNGSLESVKSEWVDNTTLKITYSHCTKVYGQQKSWRNIKIIYDGQCSEEN